jgi:ribonuclease P protein component
MTYQNTNSVSYKGLRKTDRIKGFDAFSKIFNCSKKFSSTRLIGYLNIEKNLKAETRSSENEFENPLFKNILKVGFIVSKKNIRKTARRNRIKRILRESYRLNQEIIIQNLKVNINLILGLSENGMCFYKENKYLKLSDINDDMISLLNKINEYLGSHINK